MPKMEREIVPGMAEAIERRMVELGIEGPSDLVNRTGLTYQGLLDLRRGRRKRYQARLTVPVTRVLGWSPDSIDRLLRGEEPVQRITVVRGDDGSVRDVIGAKVATVTFEELVAEVSRLRSELHDLAVLTRRLMVEMDADEMSSGDAIPADRASTEDQR